MVKVKTAFTVLVMVSLLGIAACGDDEATRAEQLPAETRPRRAPKRAASQS